MQGWVVYFSVPAAGHGNKWAFLPALAQALSDPDDRVRQAAGEALGSLGPLAQSAEPALRRALNDPEAGVRRAASGALLNLKKE